MLQAVVGKISAVVGNYQFLGVQLFFRPSADGARLKGGVEQMRADNLRVED